jgi:superfamily II DNA or RNA helicase
MSTSAFAVSPHVSNLIQPLCAQTANMLREVKGLSSNDYVEIGVVDKYDSDADTMFSKEFVVRCRSSVSDLASYTLRGNWFQRIPGAEPMTAGGYGFTAPPTDISALTIIAAVGQERIKFVDEAAKMEFWTCAFRFAKQTRVARAQAGYKQHKTVPNRAPKGKECLPPMKHQATASYCAARSESYNLHMEQSTGKTYTTILAVEEAHVPGHCQMALVVCPKNLRTNWRNELHMFSRRRICVVRLLNGELERKTALLDAFRAKISGDYDIVYVVVSYQMMVNSLNAIMAFPWDWGILDEAHNIKRHVTARCKASMRLRDCCKRRLALTGTPITNHVFDLYSQLEWLGLGYSGFTSYYAFKKFYGVWDTQISGHGVSRLLSLQNVPLLQERLTRTGFTVTKAEALPELPAKSYEIIGVEMTQEQRVVYDDLAVKLYTEIENDIASGDKRVTVSNILVRLLRLAQITSGFIAYDRDYDPENDTFLPQQIDRFDPNPKLEEMMTYFEAMREESPDSKVIIWACFVQDIRSIVARMRLDGIKCVAYYGGTSDKERDAAVEQFNNDKETIVFVGNPAAGGVGLNLTGAGCWPMKTDYVYWYSQNWSMVHRSQGEERPRGYLHESVSPTGKYEYWQVKNVDFCVEDTIDEQIRQRVADKRLNAMQIQDVRELLKGLVSKND